jgi:hypothetical protein
MRRVVFSEAALPVAIPLVIIALGLVIFRVHLMRFSDFLWGLDRTPEQRRDLARMAVIPAVGLLACVIVITFLPLPLL